jgi:hypothetical protein
VLGRERTEITLHEGHPRIVDLAGSLSRHGERTWISVHTQDLPSFSHQLRNQKGHVPPTAPDVENAHPPADARVDEQSLRDITAQVRHLLAASLLPGAGALFDLTHAQEVATTTPARKGADFSRIGEVLDRRWERAAGAQNYLQAPGWS